MKSIARQRIRKLPLVMGLFFFSFTILTLLPTPKVYADDPKPQLPLVWVDAQHTAAVDASGKAIFLPKGYTCFYEVDGKGTPEDPIKINKNSQPLPERENVTVNDTIVDSEKFNTGPVNLNQQAKVTGKVPACASGGNQAGKKRPAAYMWTASIKKEDGSFNNFGLVVAAGGWKDLGDVDGKVMAVRNWSVDPKALPVWMDEVKGGKVSASNSKRIDNMAIDPSKAGLVTGGTQTGVGTDPAEEDLCPIKKWAATWLVCPVVEGIQAAIAAMRVWIIQQLLVDAEKIFGSSTAGGVQQGQEAQSYYAVWNSFRVLAVALIIIFGIVMVASEALGFGIFNAYTIRKVLPRLLIMAIFIALSWWILKYIIVFFNNLSVWIYSAITFPFNLNRDPLDSTVITGYFLAILIAAALVSPLVVITYAITLLIAFLIATLIFAIRQIAIVLLVVTAPIWLAFNVLEGTQKITKFATGGLISLMLMGPAFAAVQAMADVIGFTADDKTDQFGLIRMSASVLGIFLISVIFVKLGGMASTITGTLNDRSKGVFDRLKNARSKDVAKNLGALKTGDRWSGRNAFTRGLNTASGSVSRAAQTGLPYNPADWKRRYTQAQGQNAQLAAASMMQAPGWSLINQDDEALRAGTYNSKSDALAGLQARYQAKGQSAEEARQNAQSAIARYESAGFKIGSEGAKYATTQQLVQTGTGYDNLEDMIDTSARALGNNYAAASGLGGFLNFATKGAKRHDMAPGAGAVGKLIKQRMDANNGRGAAPSLDDYDAATIAGIQGASTNEAVGNRTVSLENVAQSYARRINQATFDMQRAVPNSPKHQELQREVARLNTEYSNYEASAPLWASSHNVAALQGNPNIPGSAPTKEDRQVGTKITSAQPLEQQGFVIRNEQRTDARGNIQTVQVMRPEMVPAENSAARETANEANRIGIETGEQFGQGQRRGVNPNDERFGGR